MHVYIYNIRTIPIYVYIRTCTVYICIKNIYSIIQYMYMHGSMNAYNSFDHLDCSSF